MSWIAVAVEEADSYSFNASLGESLDQPFHLRPIQRVNHLALSRHPLLHVEPKVPGGQWLWHLYQHVVHVVAVFPSHLDGIPMALGRQQRCAGTFALDDGVGG